MITEELARAVLMHHTNPSPLVHHANPPGMSQPCSVGMMLECSIGELLTRVAFMHHDQGHNALRHDAGLKHYVYLKGLQKVA